MFETEETSTTVHESTQQTAASMNEAPSAVQGPKPKRTRPKAARKAQKSHSTRSRAQTRKPRGEAVRRSNGGRQRTSRARVQSPLLQRAIAANSRCVQVKSAVRPSELGRIRRCAKARRMTVSSLIRELLLEAAAGKVMQPPRKSKSARS